MGDWSIVKPDASVVDLASIGVIVRFSSGVGMPELEHTLIPYALGDGSRYDRTRVPERTIDLLAYGNAGNFGALRGVRKLLIDMVKPDRTGRQLPFELRYTGGSVPISIWCILDSGLGLGQSLGGYEELPIRLIAPDPYFYELNDSSSTPASQALTTATTAAFQKKPGLGWASLGTFAAGAVINAIAQSPITGEWYFGGSFTTINGTTMNNIAKWNGTSWSQLNSGATKGVNGIVRALKFRPDGQLLIGGDFTQAGGTTMNRITKYDPTANSFAVFGTGPGVNGAVRDIEILTQPAIYNDGPTYLPTGTVVIVGDFTADTGATSTSNGIAYTTYAGSAAFTALGEVPTAGSSIVAVEQSPTGYLWFAGTTQTGPVLQESPVFFLDADNNFEWWDASNVFPADGAVTDMQFGPDGRLYVAGPTGDSTVTVWNGSSWGSGVDSVGTLALTRIDVDQYGSLWAAGDTFLQEFHGTTPQPYQIALPVATSAIHVANDGTLSLGSNLVNAANWAAGSITTVNNTGTAHALPRIRLTNGSASTIVSPTHLTNLTTGDRLAFEFQILPGETVEIDLAQSAKTVMSNFRGDLSGYMRKGSNIGTFKLIPGNNVLEVNAGSTTAMTVTLLWKNRYWSIDGV